MKIAIVHDYLKEYGGAERVLEAIHEVWPKAPVFTSIYIPRFLGPHGARFDDWQIKTSFFQRFPLRSKLISPFRLIAPVVFKRFNFSKYDVILVSATGAYSPNNLSKNGAIQICYFHTPPRYLYGYQTAREWKKNIVFRALGEIANHFLRIADYNSSQKIDYAIANSEEVRLRIRRFYGIDAKIIYPPVDVPEKFEKTEKEDFYLAGGRLARPKHTDLIIEACAKLRRPLKVFGRGFAGYEKELKDQVKNKTNIEFLGEVSDQEKEDLMKKAKAYIFASQDEDFGITPVEAMGFGTPVIAFNGGGVKETVIDGKTGILYNENTVGDIMGAVERFEKERIKAKDCFNQAKKFSKERFEEKIKEFVEKVVKKS